MADTEKPKRPESPTTARELDFDDDDDIPASPKVVKAAAPVDTTTPPASQIHEVPPPPPPRPLSTMQQSERTLREAFPDIGLPIITAVLHASGGRIDPAFEALLGMSDPSARVEPPMPVQPPRSTFTSFAPERSQVDADAAYARQLADHYNGIALPESTRSERTSRVRQQMPRQKKESVPNTGDGNEDRERNFLEDDLPVIRDNIRKGFLETQSKVNSFLSNLKKKIDGDGDEEDDEPPRRPTGRTPTGFSSGMNTGFRSQRSEDASRRSGDGNRYDADPEVLGDDLAGLRMVDETTPRRSGRPLANPNLFKPTPAPPVSEGRRVSFQEGPPEEIDSSHHVASERSKQGTLSAIKANKWQPMAAVDPAPVVDHDPFSVGDSDEEEAKKSVPKTESKKDSKNEAKDDLKPEDAKRLQLATAEAMAEDVGIKKQDGEGGSAAP